MLLLQCDVIILPREITNSDILLISKTGPTVNQSKSGRGLDKQTMKKAN